MPANGDASSFSKPACASEAAWDATDATMQTQQPTGPKPPPSTKSSLRTLCAGLLCFECCEECC
ncbi:hypothetical protein N7452_008881 [Penicillium brevicompactum]|uniref:Uncharacterized protein n=1 Tax=Penicillium brevicompactum TaxID=5074 RepID=A0A9W9U9Q0_PENBR|nr:hypothetical protein N7452_008881 [Penicillium brevicompactum]